VRRGSLRIALGAASELGSWFAALGMWRRGWRAPPVSSEDDGVSWCDQLEDGEEPRLARGTARGARMNHAPTEPLAATFDGAINGNTRRFQLSPTRPVRPAPIDAELCAPDGDRSAAGTGRRP